VCLQIAFFRAAVEATVAFPSDLFTGTWFGTETIRAAIEHTAGKHPLVIVDLDGSGLIALCLG
jgi:hypothetical protein